MSRHILEYPPSLEHGAGSSCVLGWLIESGVWVDRMEIPWFREFLLLNVFYIFERQRCHAPPFC